MDPLGVLVVVTGVAGFGKRPTLFNAAWPAKAR
jgi:excinuclease UvrABC ATPase subunit